MPTSSTTATYLYALLRRATPPPGDAVAGAPAGVPGASPARVVGAGEGLWLVAATVPLPEYAAETIEGRLDDLAWVSDRALAHERVVEHFLDATGDGALLPMKLFILFADDARAVADVAARRADLEPRLDRVAGCREWGVRVLLDREEARRAAAEAAPAATEASSGTAFLQRKKERRDAARDAVATARGVCDELYEQLAERARETRRRPPADAGAAVVLLDAVFLVADADAFEAAIAEGAERLRPTGAELTLTGPWPAYHFAAGAG